MLTINEINSEMQIIAKEQRNKEIDMVYEEMILREEEELLRQYEAMSYDAELENFSPFDTVNS